MTSKTIYELTPEMREMIRKASLYNLMLHELETLVVNANGDSNTGYYNVPVSSVMSAKLMINQCLGTEKYEV